MASSALGSRGCRDGAARPARRTSAPSRLLLVAAAALAWAARPVAFCRAAAGAAWRRRGLAPRRAEGGQAELKAELLRLCDEFRTKQEEMWDLMDEEEKSGKASAGKGGASLLEAESFAAQTTELSGELSELRNRTVEAALAVAATNPTERPNFGWRGLGGGEASDCLLNGTWKLVFTDAADATFKKGRRGAATTFQEVDAQDGWFVNCVDFSGDSKLRGFRVFVEGVALDDSEMQLNFRKVKLLRRSRWLSAITIPLPPPRLLRLIGSLVARRKGGEVNPSDRGAGFKLLYVDDELRMHQTFDGLYFVQKRLS